MSKWGMLSSIAACVVAMSGVSQAASQPFSAEAVLVTALSAPTHTEIDGVTWHCEANKCQGSAARRATLDSHMKECRKVAKTLGPLVSYTSRGRTLENRDIATCNRLAAREG